MIEDVSKKQRELWELGDRFERLRSFNVELERRTRRKVFQIASHLVWDAYLSLYRMLIIDLAEWVGSIHAKWLRTVFQGVALGKLRNSKRLATKLAGGATIVGDPDVASVIRQNQAMVIQEQRALALKRLFGPKVASRGAANGQDIERLSKKLERWAANLHTLRNFHAHRYGTKVGKTPKMRWAHLEARITSCGRLLNDLRLLVDQSHYGLPSLEPSERDENCRDLVDLLVCGTIGFSVERWQAHSPEGYLWEKRDAYYKWLHSRRRRNTKAPFNALELGEP